MSDTHPQARPARLRDFLTPGSRFKYLLWRLLPVGPSAWWFRLRSGQRISLDRPPAMDLTTAYEVFVSHCYAPPWPEGPGESPALVVDLGANVGFGTLDFAHRWPGATIHLFEPHPAHVRRLREILAVNGLESRSVLHACAAGAADRAALLSNNQTSSSIHPSVQGAGIQVPVVDWLAWAQGQAIGFLKMDIEGAEFEILFDDRFPSLEVRALAVEWHQLPGEVDPAGKVRARLESMGFEVVTGITVEGHCGILWGRRRG